MREDRSVDRVLNNSQPQVAHAVLTDTNNGAGKLILKYSGSPLQPYRQTSDTPTAAGRAVPVRADEQLGSRSRETLGGPMVPVP